MSTKGDQKRRYMKCCAVRSLRTAQWHAQIKHPQWLAFIGLDVRDPMIKKHQRLTPEQKSRHAMMKKAWAAKNKKKLAQRQSERRKSRRVIQKTFQKFHAISLLGGWARREEEARKQSSNKEAIS